MGTAHDVDLDALASGIDTWRPQHWGSGVEGVGRVEIFVKNGKGVVVLTMTGCNMTKRTNTAPEISYIAHVL